MRELLQLFFRMRTPGLVHGSSFSAGKKSKQRRRQVAVLLGLGATWESDFS